MEKRRKNLVIPLGLFFIITISTLMLVFVEKSIAFLEESAYHSIKENVESISNSITSEVGYAFSSIRLTSESVSQKMTSRVIDDVNAVIDPLLPSTPFNFIEYILEDGWNTMNDGGTPFDASDRVYYKEGIKGNTGIWINYTPKKSKEVLLNFYTPLKYQNEIVGVLTGTLGGKSDVEKLVASSFMGESVWGFLCDGDGKIISTTNPNVVEGSLFKDFMLSDMECTEETYTNFRNNIESDQHSPFKIQEKDGDAIAYNLYIPELDWYVVQIVPASVLKKMINEAKNSSFAIVFTVIIASLIFFAYLFYNEKKNASEAIKEHRGVIEVLGKEYTCVYIINTKTGLSEAFRLSQPIAKYYGGQFKQGLIWDDGVKDYADRFAREDYKESFIKECSLSSLLSKLKTDNDFFSYEFVNDRDGEQRYFRVIAAKLPSSSGQQIVLGIADVNEERLREKEMKDALQSAFDKADAANKAKSAFLFSMSHDIRTPMNAIIGFTDMLEKKHDDENAFRECIKKIKSSSRYLLGLINNVLDLARIESGHVVVDTSQIVDTNELTSMISSLFSNDIRKKGLVLKEEKSVVHRYVYGDSLKIQQIFANIISNAVKYSKENGEIIITIIEEESESPDYGYYTAIVKDNGIGMSEEFLPHIYDEFTREHNTTESGVIGTGLGMSITKKLISLMDGDIQVESHENVGTTVTITLPLKYATKSIEEIEERKEDDSFDSLKGKRILLAEDNELNAEIAEAILVDGGMIVEKAKDGSECLRIYEESEKGYFSLILMDIQMPVMDGYEAASKIRSLEDKEKGSIPIVAMTANAFDEDRIAAEASGMNGHISKPISINKMYNVLTRVLKGYENFTI